MSNSVQNTPVLPKVSIITPTNGRPKHMKLALTNYRLFDYPRDRLEWIVVDDGAHDIAKMFPKDDQSIKYYHLSPYCKAELHKMLKESIRESNKNRGKKKKRNKLRAIHNPHFHNLRVPLGMKRNICIKYATGDLIFHMDDDDLYFSGAVKHAVAELLKGWNDGIRCVGAGTVGVFHTNRYISALYSRTQYDNSYKQVLEHTLCYDKNFWEQRKFDNQDVSAEGTAFLKKRMHEVSVISSKEYGVSLVHNENTNPIKMFDQKLKNAEANGWHFKKIPDELFLLITSLDDHVVESESKTDLQPPSEQS